MTVTVASWVSSGLLVNVGHGVTGLVPTLFLSDVQLSHPEKKYLPGNARFSLVDTNNARFSLVDTNNARFLLVDTINTHFSLVRELMG